MAKTGKKNTEPLFHIIKQDTLGWKKPLMVRVIAVLAAMLLSSVIIVIFTKRNPLEVFEALFIGAVGKNGNNLMDLLQKAAILLCISLAVTPAFKMKFWNIGAEGQVLMGALASAACMITLRGILPNWLLLVVIFVTGIIAGIIWAVIPAIFKVNWGANETLFTLMMNYCAMKIVAFFIVKWENPINSGKVGVINLRGEYRHVGWLPDLFGQPYVINILIVLGVMVLLHFYLKYSKQGFEISVVGESENTARYVGMDVKKIIIRTMAISGAICGLAGVLLVSGTHHTIATNTAGGNGFTAVMVSWLSKFNPFIMAGVSFFIAFLEKGAGGVATNTGLNASLADIIIGIMLFFIIGCEFFLNYKIVINKKRAGSVKGGNE
ncbi:MAG: ABC transporter permease [Clostridia bacterium]|nr:ABC transporter permease [Clostridia bacterium]